MSKNLVIVESPSKAKTIKKYLGEGFRVLASKGHIRDIEGVGKNSMGIDFDNNYAPHYVIDPQKTSLLETLQKEVKKADMVWLASDDDREGEAIAWHLQQVLGLNETNARRMVFPDITKASIQNAIKTARWIDYNLVNAQQARRVLDRIVGFELSPVLWRKVTTGLSAGRVQSVAVRLIVEREREIEEFVSTSSYRVVAEFVEKHPQGDEKILLKAELNHHFPTQEEAREFLGLAVGATFVVDSVTKKPAKRVPAVPFTTSSMQQEAARKLRFTVSKTMRLAQSLYEAGHITYMRTDSCSLSQEAIRNIKTEVIKQYGESYHQARQFKTKIKGAQEAHEAIRPTSMKNHVVGANTDERKLYELIWKRTLASQMADASFEKTRIEITSPLASCRFVANGEVMLFDGFMRVYSQSSEDENAMQALPPLQAGAELIFNEMVAQESFTKAPYRYREADLVEKMEDLHIGRPSTYAPIIETIQTRKYVELTNIEGTKRDYHVLTLKNGKISHKTKVEKVGQESQKLLPTDLGRVTNDFLVEQFPNILSYDFTAKEEENFDLIAAGEANWVEVIDNFYKHFHPAIQQVPSGKVAGRLIGYEPKTGAPVYAKISKIGPCIQIGDAEVDKPKFASLKPGQSLFTITLEEALELFVVHKPAPICVIDGEEVFVGKGKYGPYIRYKGGFVSIPKSMDPEHLTQEDVVGLIAHHEKQQDAIHTFGDMQVMSGRYGAYIKTPTGNYRIAKSVNVESLTQEACEQIIANSASVAPRTKKNTRKK